MSLSMGPGTGTTRLQREAMVESVVAREEPLVQEIIADEMLCRRALEADYPDLVQRLSNAPAKPEDWFTLLRGIPNDRRCVAALRQLSAEAERPGLSTPHAVERFAVLQAYLVALPLLQGLRVDDSVKRQFCDTCRYIASPMQKGDSRLAQDSDAFEELAQIVTFRRFHAGQLSFHIGEMPRAWLLRTHPMELLGLIREFISGIGGLGPVVLPHINYWRQNPMFIFKGEQERALWRITKSIENDWRIKGLIASSWLYSLETCEHFPHLSWVREFFIEQNAYVVDHGPARAEAGFLVGSEKRRRIYAEGEFRPREALVLWRRADMLAWANGHPELGEGAKRANTGHTHDRQVKGHHANRKSDARIRSGKYTLVDCKRLLFFKPRHYIALVILLPAFCAAILAATMSTLVVGCLAFIFAICLMWLFQYFFLQ
jgi:hypothetical protein